MQRLVRCALGCAVFGTALAFAGSARAAGFAAAKFGGEHGHPTTDGPTALYFNPAGLALSSGTHLYVDGTLAWRSIGFDREKSDVPEPADAQGANVGKATLFNFLGGPMFAVTLKLGEDLGLGAGFFVPFGGIGKFDENPDFEGNPRYPGAVDGPARWWNIEGQLIHAYTSVGAAYHVPGTPLSAGVAGNLIYSQIKDYRARTTAGDDDVRAEGRSLLVVDGIDFAFGAGVIVEAVPKKFWLGASYQSRPNVSGGMVLEGTFQIKAFNGVASAVDDADLHIDLPDVYRLGGRFRPNQDVELRLFGDYTRWSAVERHCVTQRDKECALGPKGQADANVVLQNIPHAWEDTFGVRAGASYFSSEELELFGGLGFETAAVPDATLEPSLADADNILIAAGGRLGLSKSVKVALSYTQLVFLPRDNRGKSKLSTDFLPTSKSPDAGGQYTQAIGFVNANLDVAF